MDITNMQATHHYHRFMLIVGSVALAWSGMAHGAAKTAPPELFRASGRSMPSVARGPEIVRSRLAEADLDLLKTTHRSARLGLTLTNDESFDATVTRMDWRSPRRLVVAGALDDTPGGSFILSVVDDAIAGIIRIPSENRHFEVRYAGPGECLVREVDPSKYPPEKCFESPASAPDAEFVLAPPDAPSIDAAAPCSPPLAVFDLVMYYTPAARIAMGGTDAAAIAQCQLAVEVSNDVYGYSILGSRIRLVHCAEINYVETGVMDDYLDYITGNYWVNLDRDAYAADFVHMVTSDGSGLGWCGPGVNKAFSVGKWDRIVNTWTLAHEMGHNQGCNHNREDAGCDLGPYAYGWHFFGNSGNEWGTVMSYLGTRIPYFSNPFISFDGQPTGVAVGEPDEAFNAKVINAWTVFMEDYRQTRYDIWVDFSFFSLSYDGSFSHPYRNLTTAVDEIATGQNASELPTLIIKTSSTPGSYTIDKPMTIRVCGGPVTIGG